MILFRIWVVCIGGTLAFPACAEQSSLSARDRQRYDLLEYVQVSHRIPHAGTFGLHAVLAPATGADSPWGAVSREPVPGPGSGAVPEEDERRTTLQELSASYRLGLTRRSAVFGYIGTRGDPAFGPPASYLRRFSAVDDPGTSQGGNWLEAPYAASEVFTIGYAWRNFKFEGSAFTHKEPELKRARPRWYKRDSTSKRLSFNPMPNWALQISQGHISSLDQLEPDARIRRTAVSATYSRAFNDAHWQTTLAWGRSSRTFRESGTGYLIESTLQLKKTHALFGRVEQVGSDDLYREDESRRRQMFKMNKVTLGYVYDVRDSGPIKYDVGALISRHLVPEALSASYGSDPTSYQMFIRFKLR